MKQGEKVFIYIKVMVNGDYLKNLILNLQSIFSARMCNVRLVPASMANEVKPRTFAVIFLFDAWKP